MNNMPLTLVCFAVKEEAQCFDPPSGVKTLVTGMGRANSEKSFLKALQKATPNAVLTCGFAGGLNPALPRGTVVFSADRELETKLTAAGAKPARFNCAEQVATTAEHKRRLWEQTSADAVEMESEIIRRICAERNIRSATVRVILDSAAEDLPLDFNELMTVAKKMNYLKLTLTLLRSPEKIPALLELQKQSRAAAQKLAGVLLKILN
jgi:adenosylhomocysteine nucleosidase